MAGALVDDLAKIVGIAGAAALASPAGGLIALWKKPTTLFMSVALGFASGILFGTIGFEMLPQSLELGSLPIAIGGFACGFLLIYGLDLFVHRGQLAGEASEQRPQVERFHQTRRPRGGEVTVLAGGTSAEELIEGLSIGVGAALQPGLGLLIALAIAVDNLAEALSIGEIIRSERQGQDHRTARRILGWTSLIGAALLVSTSAGWFLLRGLPQAVLAFLFACGGGGMFYLTVTDLVPQAEHNHYQQSAAIAMAVGFMITFGLSTVL